jgi:hypothetical protein
MSISVQNSRESMIIDHQPTDLKQSEELIDKVAKAALLVLGGAILAIGFGGLLASSIMSGGVVPIAATAVLGIFILFLTVHSRLEDQKENLKDSTSLDFSEKVPVTAERAEGVTITEEMKKEITTGRETESVKIHSSDNWENPVGLKLKIGNSDPIFHEERVIGALNQQIEKWAQGHKNPRELTQAVKAGVAGHTFASPFTKDMIERVTNNPNLMEIFNQVQIPQDFVIHLLPDHKIQTAFIFDGISFTRTYSYEETTKDTYVFSLEKTALDTSNRSFELPESGFVNGEGFVVLEGTPIERDGEYVVL